MHVRPDAREAQGVNPGYLCALHGRRVTEFGTFNGWPDRKFATAFLNPPRYDGQLRVSGGLTDLALYWSWDASEIAILDTPLLVQEQPDRRPTIAIGPADINRLIEIDEHACALRELAFWLTVPGWRAWQDFDVAADGSRIVTDAPPWQLPVHIFDEQFSGPRFQGEWYGRGWRVLWDETGPPHYRALELDHDSVAVCADARMERGLPVAPRLTVLGRACHFEGCNSPAARPFLECDACWERYKKTIGHGVLQTSLREYE